MALSWCARCAAVVLMLLAATVASGQDSEGEAPQPVAQTYVQVWLGSTDNADEAWSLEDDATGVDLQGDYSRLPFGGGVSQRLWGGVAQYGFEGGGLLSLKNDKVRFTGADPGLHVAIDTELFLAELFMGGVLSVRPTRWLRLYAAAGPSVAWGLLFDDSDDEANPADTIIVVGPYGTLFIDLDKTHGDVSVGFYGRVGIAFELDNGFTFGVSARYFEHELDFDDRGELTLDEVHYILTLGARI